MSRIDRRCAPRALALQVLFASAALGTAACGSKDSEAPQAAPPGGAGVPGEMDPNGGSSGGSTPPDDDPPSLPAPGDHVFGDDSVLELHLTLAPADLADLEANGNEEVYVPASARITGANLGEVELPRIGMRHKGAWSLHHCWDDTGGVRSYDGPCAKLSYKLKFDEYTTGDRLDGLKRLNLHASSGDASRLRELIAYSTFRDFGVDAPRTAIAKVYVNGELEGLFIAVEAIDGRYTKAHFAAGGGDGNLYKEIWPSVGVAYEALAAALATNEEAADVSGFVDFASAVEQSSAATFAADLEPWLDLDHTLRYVAVDRALKNWDGIMAFYTPSTPHNFYWYHDAEGTGRFQLIPWDMDNTFWAFDPFMAPESWVTAAAVPDWNVEPASCTPRSVWDASGALTITPPRCDLFLDLIAETQWSRFESLAAELLSGPLARERLAAKVAHYAALLEPIVALDPQLDLELWRAERSALEQALTRANSDFRSFVEAGLTTENTSPSASAEQDLGLDARSLNGFEFDDGTPGSAPIGTYVYGSTGAIFSALWNASAPLAGSHDLRFNFQFLSQPSPWDEWVNLGYATAGGQEIDIRSRSRVVLKLRADRARTVRLRLASPAYEDTFGGVWTEFGTDVNVTATSGVFTLPLASFSYPEWAKAAWTESQGWSSSDADAYAIVRQRMTGLIFAPSATFDVSGQLTSASETGYLQIDDIAFE